MVAWGSPAQVVAPVSVSSGAKTQAGGMGGAARRAFALCSLVLLGAAVVLVSQSERGGPAALGEKQQAWMTKIRRQSQGMSPERMFMTAIKSGMMAASDATLEVKPAAARRAALRAPAKTQRLQEVSAVPELPADTAPDAPPAEVTEGAEGEVAPQAEVAAEAADAQVPEQVVEGQEQIADEAVPAEDAEAEAEAAPAAAASVPAGMRVVAAIQQPASNQPPASVVFQGSPFQVPVQSPGVGIVENAVDMPPALFQVHWLSGRAGCVLE